MITWLLSLLVDCISGLVADSMQWFVDQFGMMLNLDLTTFNTILPAVRASSEAIIAVALALLGIFSVFAFIKAGAGFLASSSEHPIKVALRTIVMGVLIWYSIPLCYVALDLGTGLFGVMEYAGSQQIGSTGLTGFDGMVALQGLFTSMLIPGSALVSSIINLVCTIFIYWALVKLMLEVVERYVLLAALTYTAPLAFATGATETTSGVLKAWVRMYGSEILVIVLNIWFLRIFQMGTGYLYGIYNSNLALVDGSGETIPFILIIFVLVAWLKLAQRLDSYLSTLGLNAAHTGGGLFFEMAAAARMLWSGAKKGAGAIVGGASGWLKDRDPKGPDTSPSMSDNFDRNSYRLDSAVQNASTRAGAPGMVGTIGQLMTKGNTDGLDARQVSMVTGGAMGANASLSGEIADKSMGNMFPSMNRGMSYSGTEIRKGSISTQVQQAGSEAPIGLRMERADGKNTMKGAYTTVTDADGNAWRVQAIAPNDERSQAAVGAFYAAYGRDIGEVANAKPNTNQETISGKAADIGMERFMPLTEGYHYEGTKVSAGRISTTKVGPNGERTQMSFANAATTDIERIANNPTSPDSDRQFINAPKLSAADGTQWYTVGTPLPRQPEGTAVDRSGYQGVPDNVTGLYTGSVGTMRSMTTDGKVDDWYCSDHYPMTPYDQANAAKMTDADGNTWYSPTFGKEEESPVYTAPQEAEDLYGRHTEAEETEADVYGGFAMPPEEYQNVDLAPNDAVDMSQIDGQEVIQEGEEGMDTGIAVGGFAPNVPRDDVVPEADASQAEPKSFDDLSAQEQEEVRQGLRYSPEQLAWLNASDEERASMEEPFFAPAEPKQFSEEELAELNRVDPNRVPDPEAIDGSMVAEIGGPENEEYIWPEMSREDVQKLQDSGFQGKYFTVEELDELNGPGRWGTRPSFGTTSGEPSVVPGAARPHKSSQEPVEASKGTVVSGSGARPVSGAADSNGSGVIEFSEAELAELNGPLYRPQGGGGASVMEASGTPDGSVTVPREYVSSGERTVSGEQTAAQAPAETRQSPQEASEVSQGMFVYGSGVRPVSGASGASEDGITVPREYVSSGERTVSGEPATAQPPTGTHQSPQEASGTSQGMFAYGSGARPVSEASSASTGGTTIPREYAGNSGYAAPTAQSTPQAGQRDVATREPIVADPQTQMRMSAWDAMFRSPEQVKVDDFVKAIPAYEDRRQSIERIDLSQYHEGSIGIIYKDGHGEVLFRESAGYQPTAGGFTVITGAGSKETGYQDRYIMVPGYVRGKSVLARLRPRRKEQKPMETRKQGKQKRRKNK